MKTYTLEELGAFTTNDLEEIQNGTLYKNVISMAVHLHDKLGSPHLRMDEIDENLEASKIEILWPKVGFSANVNVNFAIVKKIGNDKNKGFVSLSGCFNSTDAGTMICNVIDRWDEIVKQQDEITKRKETASHNNKSKQQQQQKKQTEEINEGSIQDAIRFLEKETEIYKGKENENVELSLFEVDSNPLGIKKNEESLRSLFEEICSSLQGECGDYEMEEEEEDKMNATFECGLMLFLSNGELKLSLDERQKLISWRTFLPLNTILKKIRAFIEDVKTEEVKLAFSEEPNMKEPNLHNDFLKIYKNYVLQHQYH